MDDDNPAFLDGPDAITFDWLDDPANFPTANALRAALPRDLRDFVARRRAILHPKCFPILPLDTAGLPPVGPDFAAEAEVLVHGAFGAVKPDPSRLKGVLGKARKAAAEALAEEERAYMALWTPAVEMLYVQALYQVGFWMPVTVKQRRAVGHFVSGTTPGTAHGGDRLGYYGPIHHTYPWLTRPRVMVVGKYPGGEEVRLHRNFVGATSQELTRALAECGIDPEEVGDWYFTNAVKHPGLDPSSSGLADVWVKNCRPLLYNELALLRPEFVLCLGSDAAGVVIEPHASVTKLYGRVLSRSVALHRRGEPAMAHSFRAMASLHPAAVAHRPEGYPDLVNSLGTFKALVDGRRGADREAGLAHVAIYTTRHLRDAVDRVVADAEAGVPQPIAVDCEWHGRRPGESNAYLRTVQFSHKPGHAWCVVLRHAGGAPAFRGTEAEVRAELLRLLKSTPGRGNRKVRLGGHYLRADMPWLLALGVDARAEFAAPRSAAATRTHGGWDTATMCHAYMESVEGGYKLENLAARFCGVPRYDLALAEWKKSYIADRDLKDKELDGYGACPDHILHPYACYDVDATIRLFYRFNGTGGAPGLLDADRHGNDCRAGFWTAHKATLAALEMETAGMELDRVRGDTLTRLFVEALEGRVGEFRGVIGWDGAAGGVPFNPNSDYHVRELLYGTAYNGKSDPATGAAVRLRPRGVRALGLTPIKAAGKAKKTWDRVVSEGQAGLVNPAADKETLGILSYDTTPIVTATGVATTRGDLVGKLRDIKFTGQVLKGVLRRPFEMGGEYVLDDDDELTYDGGLMYWMGEDGRVRTHFGLVETGRWSSWLPNLQNISSRREDDYRRILGDRYLFPIRSIIRASEGHVLVEADYKMAEMAVLGWLAGDATMIDMVRRNSLKESHPDYIDLHSLTAIKAFRLDTPANRALLDAHNAARGTAIRWGATKDVLAAIGRKALRVAAKNVNFGVPYQRSAEAIARQCREEGADVSVADAQMLIDEYYRTYPQIGAYLAACMARVADPGWMCGTFGRYRRFPVASDQRVFAEQQRQACNFPIQNCFKKGSYVLTDGGYSRVEDLVARPGLRFPSALGVGGGIAVQTATKPVIRVEPRRGLPLELSPDHVVFVHDGAFGLVEKKAAELRPGDWVVESHHAVPGDDPDFCTPDEAYLAGLLIGDGSFQPTRRGRTKNPYATLFTVNPTYAERVTAVYYGLYGRAPSRTVDRGSGVIRLHTHVEFQRRMAALGMVHAPCRQAKVVPEGFLNASIACRAALAAGLLDAEAEYRVDADSGSVVTFTNTSRDVAMKVYLLLSSLGFAPTFRGPYANGDWQPFYRVALSGPQLRRLASELPLRHPSWRGYDDVNLRENGLLPPALVRAIGGLLRRPAAFTAAEHASVSQMRSRGYGTPAKLVTLLNKAGLLHLVPSVSLRYDEIVGVTATSEMAEMYDVSIIEAGKAPAFSLQGTLVHNCVADAMSLAASNLYDERARRAAAGETRTFRMCLQIHDALLFEVPVADAAWFIDDVLRKCMCHDVGIVPRDLDGNVRAGVGPYHLDIDVKPSRFWGEKIDPDWAAAVGLPEATPKGVPLYTPRKKVA